MLVTGLNGVFNIDQSLVTHFYVSRNNVWVHTANEPIVVECSDNYTAMLTGREIFANTYRDFVTVCGINGRSYYINLNKITSHSVTGSYLNIGMGAVNLSIECVDNATALWDLDYVTETRAGKKFLDEFAGTWLHVGSGQTYATVTAALATASAGNAIRLHAGTYTEDVVMKNGIVIYGDEGAKVVGVWTPPANSDTVPFEFRIFGAADFDGPGDIYHGTVSEDQSPPNSKIVWTFGTMRSGSYRPIFAANCRERLIMKGGLFDTFGATAQAFVDTDNGVHLDLDMVNIANCESATFIAYNSWLHSRAKIRNLKLEESNGSSSIQADSTVFSWSGNNGQPTEYGYELVNLMLVNDQNNQGNLGANFRDCLDDLPYKFVRFYNCILSVGNAVNSNVNIQSNFAGQSWGMYGNNYMDKGGSSNLLYDPSGFSIRHIGDVPQSDSPSTNINLEVMTLSNKPVKSKFQVGETVWYFVGSAIFSDTVKSVRTEVSNPNNDASGLQNNFYTLAGAGNKEFTESQLFRTRNMALWKITNSNTRLNTITLNNIDASVDWNPDISAMDMSGCDLSAVPDWTLVRADGTQFKNGDAVATLPASVDSKEEFKTVVKSYDPVDTIWTDGFPIG